VNYKNKKYLFYIEIYLLPIVFFCGVIKIIHEINFVPIFNNAAIIFSFLLLLISQIFSIFKFIESEFKSYIKVIGTIILITIAILGLWASFIISIFSYCNSFSINYENKRYYIETDGFPDIYYNVYEKNNLITMRKLNEEEIIYTFKNLNKIEDKDARDIIKNITDKSDGEDKIWQNSKHINSSSNSIANQEFENGKKREEILNNFEISDVKKIQNSSYGLIEVDHAMARTFWNFVKIKGGKIIFISEAPDTSPSVDGEVTEKGEIRLIFTDINGNVNKYKSTDGGYNWSRYYSNEIK
jgi:hypothetical protein